MLDARHLQNLGQDEILIVAVTLSVAPRGWVLVVRGNHCPAAREAQLAPASDAAELDRLVALLGRTGSLAELNAELAARLSDGRMSLETPDLKAHLWATSMAKLAVDQPGYASYRRALKRLEG